jgi:DNA adenine methylase
VFGREEHQRLAQTLEELTQRRVCTVLSNSDTRFTGQLYDRKRFGIKRVQVARSINSKATARGSVGELLVDNSRALSR